MGCRCYHQVSKYGDNSHQQLTVIFCAIYTDFTANHDSHHYASSVCVLFTMQKFRGFITGDAFTLVASFTNPFNWFDAIHAHCIHNARLFWIIIRLCINTANNCYKLYKLSRNDDKRYMLLVNPHENAINSKYWHTIGFHHTLSRLLSAAAVCSPLVLILVVAFFFCRTLCP